MKKVLYLLVTLLFTLTLVSCKKGKQITLSYEKNEIEIFVGDEVNVEPIVEVGKKVKNYELNYELSNDIATIKNGKLTAKEKGTTVVTVTTDADKEAVAKLTVVIKEKEVVEEYKVTFKDNEGNILKEQLVKKGESAVAPSNTEKEGFIFVGWDKDFSNITGNIEVNALYKEISSDVTVYKIILDPDGGVVENTEISFIENNLVTLPVPTKEGYNFLGWYEGETKVEVIENKNYTLKAVWEKCAEEYSITLDADGGVLDVTEIIFIENEQVTLPEPTKEGYDFKGWYEGETKVEVIKNKNYTLKAVWEEAIYTITFGLNGGTLDIETITFKYGDKVELPVPIKEGYTFNGWYESSKKVEEIEYRDYKLFATWSVINYTVTYELDGGTLSSNAVTKIAHGKTVNLYTPTKEYHKFLGWTLEPNSTDYITKFVATSNTIVYAHWQQNQFRINYIYEDGNAPLRQATSVADIDAEFWPEYAAWYGYTGDIASFRSTVLAKWNTGSDGGYKLYLTTGVNDIDVNFFINDPDTDPKWKDWLMNIEAGVQDINSTQSLFTSTYAGYMRVGQFFSGHSNWTAARQEAVYSKFYVTIPLIDRYEIGAKVELVGLVVEDGRTFLGWYDEDGNKVERITADMNSDLTLTAKWSESTPVESFEIDTIEKLEQYHSHQLTWSFLPTNATNKKIQFVVSDTSILEIDEKGLMYGHNIGKVIVEVIVKDNSKFNVTFEVEVYVNPYIDAIYETSSVVTVGESIQIDATLQQKDDTIAWKSLNKEVATVDESGKVTGVSEGYAEIVAYASTDENVKLVLGVTVNSQKTQDELGILFNAHNKDVHYVKEIEVAMDYDTSVIGFVSDLLYNYEYAVNNEYYIEPEKTNNRGYMSSIEFITVHYSGMPLAHQDGEVIAQSLHSAYNGENWGGTSWHYSTGNDGIFHSMNEAVIGWHAGDGTAVKFTWNPTGVKYNESDPKWPVWGISSNAKFTINGKETSIKVPYKEQRGSEGYVTDSKWLNDQGFAFKVVNGEYHMGNTYWCYSNVWEGRICSKGGNLNSIGIESACNYGSDLWLTYHITSKLVARLMLKHNLDITRVVGHHFFAAKNCPQPLLENNLELWWKFIELVEAEYAVLTQLQDYTITCKSNNPELLSDDGRVLEVPNYTTTVSYTLTVKNNKTGVTKEFTLSSVIHGQYTL